MRKIITLLAATLLGVISATGQKNSFPSPENNIYYLNSYLDNMFELEQYNLNSGFKACVMSFTNMHEVQLSFSALDGRAGVLYFMATDTLLHHHLYSVDLNSLEVLASPEFPQSALEGYVYELQVDPYSGKLYALQKSFNGYQAKFSFIVIDPETAEKTVIRDFMDFENIETSFSSLEPYEGLYYFLGLDKYNVSCLYGLDINSGDIVSKTEFQQSNTNGYVYELQINHITGKFYALQKLGNNPPSFSLIEMDPMTGSRTNVVQLPNVEGVFCSYSAINEQLNQFYFGGFDSNFNNYYYIVNLMDRTIDSIPFENSPEQGYHYEVNYPNPVIQYIQVEVHSISQGDSIRLSVPDNYQAYLWSNGETTPSIYVSDTSQYWVRLITKCGVLAVSDTVSVNVYNNAILHDSLFYESECCLLSGKSISMAHAEIISVEEGQVLVRWNFLTTRGKKLAMDVSYPVTENGVYPVSIRFRCDGMQSEQQVFHDLINVRQLEYTGKEEFPGQNDWLLYPNPARDKIQIDLKRIYRTVDTEIYTVNGSIVKRKVFYGAGNIELNVSNLEEGLYLIKVNADNEIRILKIVKK